MDISEILDKCKDYNMLLKSLGKERISIYKDGYVVIDMKNDRRPDGDFARVIELKEVTLEQNKSNRFNNGFR